MIWKCPICLHDISFDLKELPFASLCPKPFAERNLKSICLDVKGFGNSWFLICACYSSPAKCKISDFLSSCVLAAEKIYTKRKEVMFLGDFNIGMLTENESSAGSSYSLSNFCDQFCLINTITVLTRVTASTKTLWDVILVSHPERFVSSGTPRLGN